MTPDGMGTPMMRGNPLQPMMAGVFQQGQAVEMVIENEKPNLACVQLFASKENS